MGEANLNEPYVDPGWGPAVRTLVPVAYKLRMHKPVDADGVTQIRVLFLSLLLAGLLIGFVLLFVVDKIPGRFDSGIATGIAILGLAGVFIGRWARDKPLPPEAIAACFRTNFFIGFASIDAPLLIGFILAMIKNEYWPYLVALPFFLEGMATIAPGPRALKRKQQELLSRGVSTSVGRALAGETL